MQGETLKFIADAMAAADIPYDFEEFDGEVTDRYWVGEYQENEPLNESGQEECQFILTGTANSAAVLEADKQTIKQLFPSVVGNVQKLENGSRIAIFYANAMPIETGNYLHRRMQINLSIKEWIGE